MKCVERYENYKEEDLDKIMLYIRSGDIKCGRYSHLVKIDKNKIMKGKEFFKNAANNDGSSKSEQ